MNGIYCTCSICLSEYWQTFEFFLVISGGIGLSIFTNATEWFARVCALVLATQAEKGIGKDPFLKSANFMVEASIPTMILFCAKSAKMLLVYINGRRSGPVAFISARFCMRITTLQSYVIFIGSLSTNFVLIVLLLVMGGGASFGWRRRVKQMD